MHLHEVDTLIITLDNFEHGKILAHLPSGKSGEPRYTIEIAGRPARTARVANKGHRGQDRPGRRAVTRRDRGIDFTRNVAESNLTLAATAEQLEHANFLIKQIDVRAQTPAHQVWLREVMEDQLDSDGSSDNDIIEAERYLVALVAVEDELHGS